MARYARLGNQAHRLSLALSESHQPRHSVVHAALLLGTLTAVGRVSHWEMPCMSVDSFLLLFGQALILSQGPRRMQELQHSAQLQEGSGISTLHMLNASTPP